MNTPYRYPEKAVIVSDLHIGSPYFLYHDFRWFLGKIPEDYDLILNGDIIDNPYSHLGLPHQRILEIIARISHRQRVVWIRGNHDNGYIPPGFEKVTFKRLHTIGRRLLIVHGDDFDDIMPRSQVFIKVFRAMHNLRVKLGARPVHVAHYAKKWESLYRVLRKNVMTNAVDCALENGYEAVACGHTHYSEDTVFRGVRYVNTGAWTESPSFFLLVNPSDITLNRVNDPFEFRKMTSAARGFLPSQTGSNVKA